MYESEEVHEITTYVPTQEESRWRVVLSTNCDGICDEVATEHATDEAAAKKVAARWQAEHDVLTLMLVGPEPPEQGGMGAMIQSAAFVELDEPWLLPPDAIIFKHEDEIDGQPVGPVWIRRAELLKPYREHPTLRDLSDNPTAQWMGLDEATAVAEQEGLPLEES